MASQFSGKQQRFIDAYLGEANFNATRAAEIAGYKGNGNTLAQIGFKTVRNGKITDEIAKRLQASAMGTNELLMILGRKARSEHIIANYLTSNGVNLEQMLLDGHGNLIKSIKPSKNGLIVDFVDSMEAQKLIGRHLGVLNQLQTNLNIDVSNLTDEQLDRIINGESLDTVTD